MDLTKQWNQFVADYGNKAYLMMESRLFWVTKESLGNWHTPSSNQEVEISFNTKDIELRYKQSAELPFDLVAARAGDIVEVFSFSAGWIRAIDITINYNSNTYDANFCNERFAGTVTGVLGDNLIRMAHPRRVGIDYSKFE